MSYRGVTKKLKQAVDKIAEGSLILLFILASEIFRLHPDEHFFLPQREFTDKPAHHQHTILIGFILSGLLNLIDIADQMR